MRTLCNIASLESKQTTGFTLDGVELFVLQQGERFIVYENRCPHLGTPLEFQPDQFLSHNQEWIQCSTHGALFDKQSGMCVSGPCAGASLRMIESCCDEHTLYVNLASLNHPDPPAGS